MQFRVPHHEDGTVGTPEVMKKWVQDIHGTQKTNKKKKSQPQSLNSTLVEKDFFD